SRVAIIGIAEGVTDHVLHEAECLTDGVTTFLDRLSDLLSQSVFALEAVLEASEVPVGVFGFDAAHGRGDGLLLDLLHPRVAPVDGVGALNGLHGGPVLKVPRHPGRAPGSRSVVGVLPRKAPVRASVRCGVGPAHPGRVVGTRAFAVVVRPVGPHLSPPNAGTQCRSLHLAQRIAAHYGSATRSRGRVPSQSAARHWRPRMAPLAYLPASRSSKPISAVRSGADRGASSSSWTPFRTSSSRRSRARPASVIVTTLRRRSPASAARSTRPSAASSLTAAVTSLRSISTRRPRLACDAGPNSASAASTRTWYPRAPAPASAAVSSRCACPETWLISQVGLAVSSAGGASGAVVIAPSLTRTCWPRQRSAIVGDANVGKANESSNPRRPHARLPAAQHPGHRQGGERARRAARPRARRGRPHVPRMADLRPRRRAGRRGRPRRPGRRDRRRPQARPCRSDGGD